jgi:hypothetical protein
MSSSVYRTKDTQLDDTIIIWLRGFVLLFQLSNDDPKSSPKKGIGSGTRIISGAYTIVNLHNLPYHSSS